MIEVWTYGEALMPEKYRDRRLGWCDIWYRETPDGNPYAHPVSGLKIVVDMNTLELLELENDHDHGQPEVDAEYAPGPWTGTLRTDLKPLHVTQPEGVSFTVDGTELKWQNWTMRLGFNHREGPVIYQVTGRLPRPTGVGRQPVRTGRRHRGDPDPVRVRGRPRLQLGGPAHLEGGQPEPRERRRHQSGVQTDPERVDPGTDGPRDAPQYLRAPVIGHTVWVTRQHDEERWPCGDYPTQSMADDGMTRWIADDESLEKPDVVLWYVFGIHHVTRVEELAGDAGGHDRLLAEALRLLRPQPGARRRPQPQRLTVSGARGRRRSRPGVCPRPPGEARRRPASCAVAP
nr:hypothetical protein [Kribbella pittospori]